MWKESNKYFYRLLLNKALESMSIYESVIATFNLEISSHKIIYRDSGKIKFLPSCVTIIDKLPEIE